MARIALPIIALLFTAACASSNNETVSAPTAAAPIETMPAAVGDYRLTEVTRFPIAAAGAMYMYRGWSIRADVYLYPLDDAGTSSLDDPYAYVRAEAELFPQALELSREQGRFEDFVIVSDSAIVIPGGVEVPGWHTRARLRPRNGWHDSHQYLFSFPGQMVKVRVTEPVQASDTSEIDRFVRDLIARLTEPPA